MEKGIKILKPRDFYFGEEFGEEFEDIYVEIKNIRKGDVFFECERGENYKLVAVTNARRINDGWYCVVENTQKERAELFVSEMTEHPGPTLFREPIYLTKIEKQVVYVIE